MSATVVGFSVYPDTLEQLERVAHELGLSKSCTIRQLIRKADSEIAEQQPYREQALRDVATLVGADPVGQVPA